MGFLKIFFSEESKIGLCAFEREKLSIKRFYAEFNEGFEPQKTFRSDFDKNILLI